MEDGNIANPKDDKNTALSLAKIYSERGAKFTPNGHEFIGEASSTVTTSHKNHSNVLQEDKSRKRINPLRIHLGKRPYVDNSLQYYNSSKKRRTSVIKTNEPITAPIVPKLIPKRVDRSQFHNVSSHTINAIDNESDKPVPRLVPKSQLSQYKKSKMERSPKKEHSQNVGLQPMVNFKCRKCCSMSFNTLALLKEHQLICQAHSKEPALSPEEVPENDSGGPSRVTRKVYLCSACGTYYENWNLFLHMREIHNRHICLYCLGMFAKAEKLSSHLANKHNVQEYSFDNKEEVLDAYNGAMYLMCCVCDEICSEQDDFFNHDCNDVKPRPVPVLVSKSGLKSNNLKKNKNHVSTNGITSVSQEAVSTVGDNLGNSELKIVIPKSLPANTDVKEREAIISDTSFNSESSDTISKDNSNNIDSGMELESPNDKAVTSTTRISPTQPNSLPNGDEQTDDSDTRESDNYVTPSLEKEKECGIKLKLSLNNANSPVIINSTVDPSVGKNKAHKPPTRMRRPPKRYEKDMKKGQVSPLQLPSKLPSIKMTICDKANSPFIKSTIYEMDSEPSIKPLNNNLESMNPEHKPENVMKTTIYDNKLEEENTMNRVPKLTVRVPKELLDKDSSSDDSSDSESSDKLTVDENNVTIDENNTENGALPESEQASLSEENVDNLLMPTEENQESQVQNPDESCALKPKTVGTDIIDEVKTEEPVITEPDIPITELTLNRPLDKYPLKELLKVFLGSTVLNCIYCNHARKIAVNCQQLSLHMVAEHRFSATVDSITAEELMPETITAKVKAGAEDLQSVYINLDCYDSVDKCDEIKYDYLFECFQCFFKTAIHKELCIHNRKMHQKTILWCVMCKSNFYTYSELLCHLCPGTYDSESDIKFRCHLCNVGSIPSSFRLMVHLRKIHHTCDVCLEFCHNQQCLSNHVWKHKLHHLCYRCGIAYRNKLDISNHLFWKHGTEGVLCKKCLHKKWPHVYHFCSPPAIFICEDCNLQFTKAVYLKVHKRFHTNEYPHVCTEESCTEKFVSKKLLNKHIDEHRKKLFIEELSDLKPPTNDIPVEIIKDSIPVIDLIDDKPKEEAGTSEVKEEHKTGPQKKTKKKKKDKDALLLDVNLPALNLSESDSSDESDSGFATSTKEVKDELEKSEDITSPPAETDKKDILIKDIDDKDTIADSILDENKETKEEEKTDTQQILDIWDNFKKYQAKVEKQKEKLPPLVPIRKHVCESDHDYCIIPSDLNGDEEAEKKKSKKTPKKKRGEFSSSSSSSSDSDSSCSCGSNCSCSSSSGSSSSSSSDSDSSDDPGTEKKKPKRVKRLLPVRRLSNGSNVDVMGMSETPILIPEKTEPPIAESDLETSESETDEEFYDENPQQRAKMNSEKRNQLLLLTTTAPSDGGSVSGEASRPITPVKEAIEEINEITVKEKPSSSKKKSKKKKKSKSSRKHLPIKINIPKDVITKGDSFMQQQIPNKITISLQSNTVQIPEASNVSSTTKSNENKRASKRRRVPNKFYGYSSDEEGNQTQHTITPVALKPQLPPKLEWRKEDLPSPTTHKPKKEAPSQAIAPARLINYPEPIRLTTPIPDPVPPRILMNTESMESSDSDSSDEGALEICQPYNIKTSVPAIPPTYLNSGTSSLPYAFKRPVVREAREGESVYCYCRCPYDEVSEMIACDAEGCTIEWFHFECVGIMVPPKGKWYCPECRKNQNFPGVK